MNREKIRLNYLKYRKYKNKIISKGGDIENEDKDENKNNSVNNSEIIQSECKILNTDTILFGDGGSTAIIVIRNNNIVYKFFTMYYHDNKLKEFSETFDKLENTMIDNEINIYKLLTKNIMDENISLHYVRYIKDLKCGNADEIFKSCPEKYTEFLSLPLDKKTKLCSTKYRHHPHKKLRSHFRIIEIEYCNYSCVDFIKDVSKLSTFEMELYLDIFFFQIIYTIIVTQEIYPHFAHNDLFMRNILGNREKDIGNYYVYTYKEIKYHVPQKKYFPKINDFGYTNLNEKYKTNKLKQKSVIDIYNLIYDVYNGQNLGGTSLTKLLEGDTHKLEFLKKYFNNYFNVDMVNSYKTNSQVNMNNDWNNIDDDEFRVSIGLKNPEDLMKNYFSKTFSYKGNVGEFKLI